LKRGGKRAVAKKWFTPQNANSLTLTTVGNIPELVENERNIRNWAKQQLFPGAELKDLPRGPYWLIPEKDLKGFEKPSRGRPSTKNKEAKAEH
jgi:hypothetical protein